MSSELLEYLVEYCVQNGHISVRYMETVAMSWHEKGIRTALEAKDYSASYSRDSFAVMKAFGINSRKPAAGAEADGQVVQGLWIFQGSGIGSV